MHAGVAPCLSMAAIPQPLASNACCRFSVRDRCVGPRLADIPSPLTPPFAHAPLHMQHQAHGCCERPSCDSRHFHLHAPHRACPALQRPLSHCTSYIPSSPPPHQLQTRAECFSSTRTLSTRTLSTRPQSHAPQAALRCCHACTATARRGAPRVTACWPRRTRQRMWCSWGWTMLTWRIRPGKRGRQAADP